jgi:hypothetical protein
MMSLSAFPKPRFRQLRFLLRGALIIGLLGSWWLPGPGISAARALSVEEYCQLAAEMLEVAVDEQSERLAALRRYGPRSREYLGAWGAIGRRHDARRQALLGAYGTTTGDYIAFMGAHEAAVKNYLAGHEPVQARIDALARRLASLVDQHEALVTK